jgi:hypothetical protein
MKKIILGPKRVLNARKYFAIVFGIACMALTTNRNHPKSDDEIFDAITTRLCSNTKEALYINSSADNTVISEMFEENFKDSLLFKEEKSKIWLAKKNGKVYNDDSVLLAEIFSKENYNHIRKLTTADSKWDSERKNYSCSIKFSNDKHIKNINISRPCYTKDNKYALSYFTHKGVKGLYIFKKNITKWEYYKFLPLSLS